MKQKTSGESPGNLRPSGRGGCQLKESVRSLYARNIGQILGPDTKTPVDFVVCYTPDCAQTFGEVNKLTGATGVAIKLASLKNIPVFNFAREDAREKLEEFLKS